MALFYPATTGWLMQAASSTTGAMITWKVSTQLPDWSGANFPGPGSPNFIAATRLHGRDTAQ